MKKFGKAFLAFFLAILMTFEAGEIGIAFALDEVDKAINPVEHIELTVPERLADGGSWFFVPETHYMVSEKSPEKLYIPIQRTGDLDAEAEVTLKVIDYSAHHDVNYSAEIYKETVEPEIIFDDMAIVDLIQNADEVQEFEPIEDENELGEMIYANGGAEIVDGEGNTIATVTATPLDENGNPIEEEEDHAESGENEAVPENEDNAAAAEETDNSEFRIPDSAFGEVTEGEWTEPVQETAKTPTQSLRDARNAYTGTTSDRQELSSSEPLYGLGGGDMTEDEFNHAMADAIADNYPGKEYHLTFAPGEAAKFLVVTPMYSEAAEGDAQILLMLKNPGEGYGIGEDVNPVAVIILDEDEPEPVCIDMAADTVVAENGKAAITVNRSGRINALKGVRVTTWGGSAKQGEDYSGVGAELWFSMGLTTRSLEIPVGQGSEEKDFYVTITALGDETVTRKTTHVIIPKAEPATQGSLMGISDVNGHPYTDPINLRAGYVQGGGSIDSDTTFWLNTPIDDESSISKYFYPASTLGYAYDGVYAGFSTHLEWCDGATWLSFWNNGSGTVKHRNDFDDGGTHSDHWLYAAWGDPKAPDQFSLETQNTDNEGAKWNDSSVTTWFRGVHLIKRQFDIKVETAEVKPLIGVSDKKVLADYESVYLDGNTYASQTHWTGESFSVTAKTKSPLRMVGLEAKTTDNKWVRIASITGITASVVVELNETVINSLQNQKAIRWSKNGACDHGGDFYKGTITVRPVFDYIDATVEVQADDKGYGSLCLPAPNPSLLWDFNSDNAMSSIMGSNWSQQVSYAGAKSGADDYYTFTVSGGDPYVSMETGVSSASDVRWVKIRARTSGTATRMQLFASCGSAGKSIGSTCFNIPIKNDGQWHEYVVEITNSNWKDRIQWLRLDPLDGCRSGDKIDIDYVAFFPEETSANAYQPGSENSTVQLALGKYTYHVGDVLNFTSVLSEKGESLGMGLDGVEYELRTQGSTGPVVNKGAQHYINDVIDLRLGETSGGDVVDRPYYRLKPSFTHQRNQMMVQIRDVDLEALDTTRGFLAEGNHIDVIREGDLTTYVVATKIRANDLYALSAYSIYDDAIPIWTTSDGAEYSGSTFYTLSNPLPEENIITLTVPEDQKLGYAVISGTVTTSTFNLNTQRSTLNERMVENAWVTYEGYGAWSQAEGKFELPAIPCVYNTRVRFLVDYNGFTGIQEVGIPGSRTRKIDAATQEGEAVKAVKADAGIVKMQSFSPEGAHVESVQVEQSGKLLGAVDALSMNGKRLTATIKVASGQYVFQNQTYTENIKDVTVFFMDQDTGRMHASFSSNATPEPGSLAVWGWVPDETGGGTFTLEITKFDPEHDNDWTYNDALMVRLTTDKQSVTGYFTGATEMHYEPVSTGFAVIADPDYKAQAFDMTLEDIPGMLGIEPISDEDGNLLDDDKRASFGSFPYIGEITTAVKAIAKIVNSATQSEDAQSIINDLAAIDDAEYDERISADSGAVGDISGSTATNGPKNGNNISNIVFSVMIQFKQLFYGGTRVMLGLVVSYGGGSGYQSQKNPMNNANSLISYLTYKDTSTGAYLDEFGTERIGDTGSTTTNSSWLNQMKNGEYGGPYFKIAGYVGFYCDFGYIELKTLDENGLPQKTHDAIWMGAGGFFGFSATVGYTAPIAIGPVPAYFNAEGGVNLTVFFGTTSSPEQVLDRYESLDDFNDKDQVHALDMDFGFNFDFMGRAFISLTFGVGIFKVIGVRITAEVGFEFGYSNNVADWYPQLFDSGWGCTMEAGFSGTIDLILTSIPVYSATWPLPVGTGFMRYMQEVRRANRCIRYVENGIRAGKGTQADRDTAYSMCRELEVMVDAMSYDRETIEDKTYALKNWAYDHDIIDWVSKNSIEVNAQGGIVGTVINAALEDDSGFGIGYRTNPHVHSRFVGNDAQLMAAYGIVRRTDVVTDAYAQPSSQIVAIGGGSYLMVYLDDTLSRDAMQAATLKWTVYNAADGSFTEPRTLQSDSTADSRPNLTDAGDRIIVSWASATDKKLGALKAAVSQELESSIGVAPGELDIQEALEADPARVFSTFDIFTAEFSKSAQSFGAITQLTDDDYYDDFPMGVYDEATGDVIVMYTKTAQDDGSYASDGDQLLDLVAASPDPEKTYSVVMYMLYNNQTDAVDTRGQTHEPGWATDYLFPNETDQDLDGQAAFLAAWGGQRFLPSTVRTESGEYADPPITDLTVCYGYNGLAAYAYTVDMDFDLDTAEDRALFFQAYNFKTHGTYVPIRVAGSVTEEKENYDPAARAWVTQTVTRQVEVGVPKLIRNGGSTFLFWREDGQSLKYLNLSELLNAKVATKADPGENDWTWAVRSDGTFATDAGTGLAYEPRALRVDYGSLLHGDAIEITDYNVITDEDDNLYVVWTDSVSSGNTPESDGANVTAIAQEIYATALIRQETVTGTDTTETVRWSKPYRITRDNEFNDGVVLALDPAGGLIIVHNRFSKLTASSEEEVLRLVQEGKIGLTQDKDGKLYAASLTYNSPVTLSVTRCDKIGSLEATLFEFSDYAPVAGETVRVDAAIENVGLINAEGCEISFYEYRDGVRGRQIGETITFNEAIPVNTARSVSFLWTVPAEGANGCSIQAVIREKRADGSYYDATESFSGTFNEGQDYFMSIDSIEQVDDDFLVHYRIANTGNAPTADGTTAVLQLKGLYGNLNEERYAGVGDGVLYSADVTDKLSVKTAAADSETGLGTVQQPVFEDEQTVSIPAEVFRFCGYDAIVLQLTDAEGSVIAETSQKLVIMDAPMNLDLNGGKTLRLSADETAEVKLSYDTTAFIENHLPIYTVSDPGVIAVDETGTVKAVGSGTATLTATLLPSGRTTSVTVTVSDTEPVTPVTPVTPVEPEPCDRGDDCPMTAFADLDKSLWYHDGVHWALENGVMNGVGDGLFAPNGVTSRGMIVTMLYRMEGEPTSDYAMSFADVAEGAWYARAVRWAAEHGIVNGYSAETFGPDDPVTREQIVTILLRYAQYKGVDTSAGELKPITQFTDASEVSEWAVKAMRWAVNAGIINGVGNDLISPRTQANRAQVATMLMRYAAK